MGEGGGGGGGEHSPGLSGLLPCTDPGALSLRRAVCSWVVLYS